MLVMSMVVVLAAGCGNKENNSATNDGNATSGKKGSVYFLNFKPEIAEIYEKIAKDYEAETGVKVKVVTAAAGTYETKLKSEISKSEAPTIFQINGPVGFQSQRLHLGFERY